MLKEYTCKGCGEKFEAHDWRKRKYCSKRCKGLYDKSGQFKNGYKWNPKQEEKRVSKLRENHVGMLGKQHTEETKKLMSESSKKPYNYIDGGYRGKIPTDECSLCGESRKRTIIHHKDKNRKNNDISNLQAVCNKCHSKIHRGK